MTLTSIDWTKVCKIFYTCMPFPIYINIITLILYPYLFIVNNFIYVNLHRDNLTIFSNVSCNYVLLLRFSNPHLTTECVLLWKWTAGMITTQVYQLSIGSKKPLASSEKSDKLLNWVLGFFISYSDDVESSRKRKKRKKYKPKRMIEGTLKVRRYVLIHTWNQP